MAIEAPSLPPPARPNSLDAEFVGGQAHPFEEASVRIARAEGQVQEEDIETAEADDGPCTGEPEIGADDG